MPTPDPKKIYSFATAMLDFFGRQPEQNAAGFMAELKALDDSDRAYFKAGLIAAGYSLS